MESILDDIDAMIGELDDLNYSPNKKSDSNKKDPNVIELTEKTKDSQGFADLINDLAAFDPTPTAKDKTLDKEGALVNGNGDEEYTNHKLIRGGSLRSKSEESNKTLDRRKGSLKENSSAGRNTSLDRRKGSSSDSNTFERKRTLSRKGSDLDNFTLLPSPAENIKITMSDGNLIKTVRVERSQSAWDVCLSLMIKNELNYTSNWTLVEQLSDINCERALEDHEIVFKIYKTWGQNGANNKLSLVENNKKWEFLEHPEMFFPSSLLDRIRGRSRDDVEEVLTQEYFGDKPPPVEGYLYFKDSKHSWGRKYFILRSSGLYYSTKGKSKSPQDLTCFTTLQDISVYFCVDAKVDHKAPTPHALSFKNSKATTVHIKDMKCVAADTEQDIMRWYHALRVVKFGDKIPENRATVLLEVTQEIERLNEEKKHKAEEETRKAATEKASSSSIGELKKPPPPPNPKPNFTSELTKPPPKPIPSPKPQLKMQLPVPPQKPKINMPPPPAKRESAAQQPPVYAMCPPSPKPTLHGANIHNKPNKPIIPAARVPIRLPTDSIAPAPIQTPSQPQPTPQVPSKHFSFAEAQAELAKRLNGTVQNPTSPSKPTNPNKPPSITSKPSPFCTSQVRSNLPSPAEMAPPGDLPPPPPLDDLPPPPADFLVEQPALIDNLPPPVIQEQPARSKISEMVKSLNEKKIVGPTRPISSESSAIKSRSVSELTSHLNNTLKKTHTAPSSLNKLHPSKPENKPITLHGTPVAQHGTPAPATTPFQTPENQQSAGLSRSQTCPQIAPNKPTSGAGSLVHKMSQELAGKLGARAPIMQTSEPDLSSKNHQTLPRHNIHTDVPIPPPARFQTMPRHTQPIRAPHPSYPVAHYASAVFPSPAELAASHKNSGVPSRLPGSAPRVPGSASRLPGSVPPPPPSRDDPTPPLPSRKDSLVASQRSRTMSGSSAGSQISHSSSQYSSQQQARPDQPPVRPPPRVQSRDKLRSSLENLTLVASPAPPGPGNPPPMPVSTASPTNHSTYRGIPNVFQRNAGLMNKPLQGTPSPPAERNIMSPTRWQEQTLMQDISQFPRDISRDGYQEVVSDPNSYPTNHVIRDHTGNSSIPVNINHIRAAQRGTGGVPPRILSHHQSEGNLYTQQRGIPMFNRGYSMGQLNGGKPVSAGSNNSEEVVYEYIEEEPHKVEHLQHWLANVGPYDDDALSITSDNVLGGPGFQPTPTTPTMLSGNMATFGGNMVTPPPRSESKRPINEPHSKQPWYHGPITRDTANSLLATHGRGDGLFLIRSSTSNTGDFVLSMAHEGQVKHFQITQRGGRPPWYAIEDGPAFPDIIKLVQHYSSSADRLPTKLSSYCMNT